MSLLIFLDIFGIIVFSINGYLTATEKKLDFFGALIISFVTAIGGGTIRDILLGVTPVSWLTNPYYIYCIIFGVLLSTIFKEKFLTWKKTFLIFDTLGISVFTILGLTVAHNLGFNILISCMMGTITAVFGGLLRDILTNQLPYIMHKDLYATICFLGGLFYFLLMYIGIPIVWVTFLSITFIITFRTLAIKYKWELKKLT